jgi:hypothetical protein
MGDLITFDDELEVAIDAFLVDDHRIGVDLPVGDIFPVELKADQLAERAFLEGGFLLVEHDHAFVWLGI